MQPHLPAQTSCACGAAAQKTAACTAAAREIDTAAPGCCGKAAAAKAAVRCGDVIRFARPPRVRACAAVGGKKEGEGPLAPMFDVLMQDNRCEAATWEQAESLFARRCLQTALEKGGVRLAELDAVLAGDLQCQCTASSYTMRGMDVPFVGLYGACSTMAEALALAACMTAGGAWARAAAMSSSHFCAAERQYRTPLEYGGKRTPTAQWTATAAGAAIVEAADAPVLPAAPANPGANGCLAAAGAPVEIEAVCFGRVRDLNVTDINNMGAAMAPAAAETLLRYFAGTGESPAAYDAVYTGDLGLVGSRLLAELLQNEGLSLPCHRDCGLLLFDRETQDVQAGGSGAGCGASVLCGHILPGLARGVERRVLFVATGALMSQTTYLEGESIPGIAHLVALRRGR